jgi:hypothetical protein
MGRAKSLRPTKPSSPPSGRVPRTTLPWGLEGGPAPRLVEPDSRASGIRPRRPTRRPVAIDPVPVSTQPDEGAAPDEPSKKADDARKSGRREGYVAIDELGDSAVRAARKCPPRNAAPRCIASASDVRAAPLDQKAMFLMSHIDGTLDEDGLVDATGFEKKVVRAILEELILLGLVALPR